MRPNTTPNTHTAALLQHGLTGLALALIGLLALVAATVAVAPEGKAMDHRMVRAGDLVIENAWVRATPPGARAGGGYVTIRNEGVAADRLIAGRADFAGRVEIHEMRMEGEVMQMRPLPDGLEIPAGDTVTLKPGGYHVMFMGLKQGLEAGHAVSVTLIFDRAGAVELIFPVAKMGATSHDHGGMKHE
jgi:hypothetical protein